jgi:hypothetical protein
MPRQSAVYEVLIASPSDVLTERRVLAEVLEDWNSANSRSRAMSLQALRWELDGVPASGARPQEILNKQLVENADILIAVFGARLGTPTGQAASGTVEEIEHFRSQGKPVLLYFSEADIPHNHDAEQFRLLTEYRKKLEVDTLYQTFNGVENLRRRATRDLAHTINTLALGPTGPIREKTATNKSQYASVLLQAQSQGVIPTTSIKLVRVYGTIENHSSSKRIREYSCTLSVPKCCLTFNSAMYPSEVESRDANYRKFRHTEVHHRSVSIHQGDRFQVIAVEIAVGHLSQLDREKCLRMDIIGDATVDDEALQARKTVAELMGI